MLGRLGDALAKGECEAMSEADNRMRWRRNPGHYEVWYLTFNHRPTETGFWIRYTLEAPTVGHGEPYCQLWFALFDAQRPERGFAINRRLPIAALTAIDAPFEVRVADAVLRHGAARGRLAGAGHEASWDLSWSPPLEAHHHLPGFIYRSTFADTQVLSPALSAALRGRLEVDGRGFELLSEPGCQTHLWGRKHAHAWAWSHCNAFEGVPGAALETLTVRLRRRGVTLPSLSLLSLYLGDRAHHFRELPGALAVHGHYETGSYRLVARSLNVRIEVELRCRPQDLVLTPYQDPDGEATFCHNTEIADCHVLVSERRGLGLKKVAELWSPRAGHFEYAMREPDPAIARRHQLVP
jgi:hypothetical protein